MSQVSEWIVLLLVPFLVIGVGALIAGLVTLRVRRRFARRTRSTPLPQVQPHWQDALAEPPLDAVSTRRQPVAR